MIWCIENDVDVGNFVYVKFSFNLQKTMLKIIQMIYTQTCPCSHFY